MFGIDVTEDELASYILCVARSERSPDMQGYAVRLSTFVANICIAILIRYSGKPVEESIGVLMLQVYSILLSTVIAMIRKGLSVSDAHFALTLTISPLSLYLVYSTYRFIRSGRTKSYLYSRIKRSQHVTAILSIIMAMGWIAIDVMIYFKDSDCKVTLWGWIIYKLIETAWSLFFSAVLIGILPLVWVVYVVRHWRDIRGEYRRHMEKTKHSGWRGLRWARAIGRPIKILVISQWDVITTSHNWLSFYVVLIFYITWGSALIIWAVDMQKWFYEVIVVTFTTLTQKYVPSGNFDPFSYGQLLAIAVAIQPAWAVCELVVRQRVQIRDWLLDWPGSLGNGIVFIVTGRRNPWKKHLEARALRQREGTNPTNNLEELPPGRPYHYRKVTEGEMHVAIGIPVLNFQAGDRYSVGDNGSPRARPLLSEFAVSPPAQSYDTFRRPSLRHEREESFSSYTAYQPLIHDSARYGRDMV